MAKIIGIDLGTTNSVISIYRRGAAESIPVASKMTMPSVVSYKPDGSILVGAQAKAAAAEPPFSGLQPNPIDLEQLGDGSAAVALMKQAQLL